jgi:hypothetical protein
MEQSALVSRLGERETAGGNHERPNLPDRINRRHSGYFVVLRPAVKAVGARKE